MGLVVPGSQLRGNADPTSFYVHRRSLAVLQEVGGLSAAQLQILARADKLRPSNADQMADTFEVSSLWDKDALEALYPDERAALEGVWGTFKITNAEFPAVAIPGAEPEFTAGMTDMQPPDPHRPVDALPAEHQAVAKRLSFILDKERNPPAIRFAEVVAAGAKTELLNRLTREEIAALDGLTKWLAAQPQAPQVSAPTLSVPNLGTRRFPVTEFAGAKVNLVLDNQLTLDQTRAEPNPASFYANKLVFTCKQIGLELEIPAGCKAVVTTERPAEQTVVTGPRAEVPGGAGAYLLELFDSAGHKLGDTSFTLADMNRTVDLTTSHLGKRLFVDIDNALEPELTGFERTTSLYPHNFTGTRARWRLVPEGTANHTGDVEAARAAFIQPPSPLKDGTYTRVNGGVTLKKYPGPLFEFVNGAQRYWMIPTPRNEVSGIRVPVDDIVYFARLARGELLVFNPSDSTLHLYDGRRSQRFPIKEPEFSWLPSV